MAARIEDIREHHRGTAKYIVLQDHPGVNRDIILNLNVITNYTAGGDHNILTNIAPLTNDAISHNMAEMPYFCAFPNLGRLVDE
jgi:hypothetical protein